MRAVVTAARCSYEQIDVDYQTVDASIRQTANHYVFSSAQVDVQLKCTSQDVVKDDHVAFSIEKKYFDKLRDTRRYEKIILVVMVVPTNLEDWLIQDDDRLILHKSAYWMSLHGEPALTDPNQSTTLHIPKAQRFDVEQLLGILSRIGNGKMP
ncbi:DUF4365 domain-containing protein [Jatrophihabitans telluris]|uniref:DUF4365 domain-containing protein n=1 Tax=Jatrophihabitans telluris TaxID=2038343 RepID=A0ABY4R0G3_9ACTN|nr:DUF4365 domain-containing protein [Jatrophihabitans telluris]